MIRSRWHRDFVMRFPMWSQPNEPSQETLTDIRTRLGRVCQSYSAEEFASLVRQIASVQAKYDALRIESFLRAARQLASERSSGTESPWR